MNQEHDITRKSQIEDMKCSGLRKTDMISTVKTRARREFNHEVAPHKLNETQIWRDQELITKSVQFPSVIVSLYLDDYVGIHFELISRKWGYRKDIKLD